MIYLINNSTIIPKALDIATNYKKERKKYTKIWRGGIETTSPNIKSHLPEQTQGKQLLRIWERDP